MASTALGVQHQRLGQLRAQQAMPAGMAEGTDAVQGFRVVVERSTLSGRRPVRRGRPADPGGYDSPAACAG